MAEANASKLKVELAEITMPIVLTEGRTDAAILQTAWAKLYTRAMPFRVRSCETGVVDAGSGNGGATSLGICLKAVASDSPHAVIGLFDFDDAGLSAYKLDKNFKALEIKQSQLKHGIHGKSYAFLLPVPEFRTDCQTHKNLPIEYLFNDEHLAVEVDGRRLGLKRKKAFKTVGEQKYEFDLDDVTHLKDVGEGKADFANIVVPSLPPVAFEAFRAVFDIIESIIEFEIEA